LPNINGRTIIVPGGRFQESYYWDTYWIIKGLIVCDLLDTAQALVENFVLVIAKYGFIPNGFR
jgi:alpha,alpha-trehalase